MLLASTTKKPKPQSSFISFILSIAARSISPLLGAAMAGRNQRRRENHRQVAIRALPSSTSAIRIRVPLVVSAGSAAAS